MLNKNIVKRLKGRNALKSYWNEVLERGIGEYPQDGGGAVRACPGSNGPGLS